jgi:phage shock protein A
MKLLQRVMALVRANLDEVLEQAHDPEKILNQLLLDLKNQYIQVKTTVAQNMADRPALEKRITDLRFELDASRREAHELLDAGDEPASRAAVDSCNSCQRAIDRLERQLEAEEKETDALILALGQLDLKIAEVDRNRPVLLARHTRNGNGNGHAQPPVDSAPDRLNALLQVLTHKDKTRD